MMPIPPDVPGRLGDLGYEHLCFISWAHLPTSMEMTSCVDRLEEEIGTHLAPSFPTPSIFRDKTALRVGDEWEKRIAKALCRSVAMVAICTPMYYHPQHRFCGLEWAAMEQLSRIRLVHQDYKAIIPVIHTRSDPFPEIMSPTQYIDISRIVSLSRAYHRRNEFRQKCLEIVNRIGEIATALVNEEITANCEQFSLPDSSAFEDYMAEPKPFPFRSKVNYG